MAYQFFGAKDIIVVALRNGGNQQHTASLNDNLLATFSWAPATADQQRPQDWDVQVVDLLALCKRLQALSGRHQQGNSLHVRSKTRP